MGAEFPWGSESIRCAGYDNPRPKPDYGPRDPRVWLSVCLHRGCPADRCLTFRDP